MNRNMEAITWALHARGISPTAFRLLIQLCSYVNSSRSDFEVWPSHKTLAEAVEISPSGVKRHLKELVDAEYIEARPGMRSDGATSANVYSISVDSSHRMPGGAKVNVTPPPVQSDLPPSPALDRAQVTTDLCNEPLEGTSENGRVPPLPSEEHTPEDLFGDPQISGSTAIALPRGSLIDHVGSAWKALHARYPRIPEIRVMSEARKKAIARRAAEVVQASQGALDAYQVWDMVLAAIANDPWLRGESNPRQGWDRAYVVEIDHVLRTRGNPNFIQILERSTTNERDRDATSDPTTGRQYGPAEQATRAALARLRAARESGG